MIFSDDSGDLEAVERGASLALGLYPFHNRVYLFRPCLELDADLLEVVEEALALLVCILPQQYVLLRLTHQPALHPHLPLGGIQGDLVQGVYLDHEAHVPLGLEVAL